MFDIGGIELLLVAVVAILVVGPRELPGMLRGIGRFVGEARKMTRSVQRQFNDALKEAELDEVRQTIEDVRGLNPATQVRRTLANEFKPFSDASKDLDSALKNKPPAKTGAAKKTATASNAKIASNPKSETGPKADPTPAPRATSASELGSAEAGEGER